jgi:hypothetical protein
VCIWDIGSLFEGFCENLLKFKICLLSKKCQSFINKDFKGFTIIPISHKGFELKKRFEAVKSAHLIFNKTFITQYPYDNNRSGSPSQLIDAI